MNEKARNIVSTITMKEKSVIIVSPVLTNGNIKS